jgi:DNA-directed RNA polymerase specialized sigma24 family protein
MRDAQGSGELERLLAEHGGDLMRTAALLTGSRQDGEDLLQAALERLLRRGRRLDNPAGYLRRTLYNLAADGWRRQGAWRRKLVVIRASGPAAEADVMAAVDLRDALIRSCACFPRSSAR